MKGMRKISRGTDFKGVVEYVFFGEKGKPRAIPGELIGGNLSSEQVEDIKKEFTHAKKLRPDIKSLVWHNSLRLPAGERVSKEELRKIGDRYMKKMRFKDTHQRIYVLHDDPDGQHIHIVASRISLDGKLFLGKNENLKSTRVISGLEKEFGLTITKGVDYDEAGKIVMPDKSNLTRNEIEKAVRTGVEPIKQQLQKIIDAALPGDKTSLTSFVERLESAGVSVRLNMSSKGINGFSFTLDNVSFSGSKLGANYKYKKLEERGLNYDQNRDGEVVKQLQAEARPGAHDDRATPDNRRVDSASDRERSADSARAANRDHESATDRPGPAKGAESLSARAEDATGREEDPAQGTEENGAGALAAGFGDAFADHEFRAGGSDFDGVDVADVDIITTGNKALDQLARSAHKSRMQQERESKARQRSAHAIPPIPHNHFAQLLASLAKRSDFSAYQAKEQAERRAERITARVAAQIAKQIPDIESVYTREFGSKMLDRTWLRRAYDRIELAQKTDPLLPAIDSSLTDRLTAERLAELGMPAVDANELLIKASRGVHDAAQAAQIVATAYAKANPSLDPMRLAERLSARALTTRTQDEAQSTLAAAEAVKRQQEKIEQQEIERQARKEQRRRDHDGQDGPELSL